MNETSSIVHRDPDILGGTLVFVGTRVPVQTFLDYLEAGDSFNEFLTDFPGVTREQIDECAPRRLRVEPGNYMCFVPPWNSGEYDS